MKNNWWQFQSLPEKNVLKQERWKECGRRTFERRRVREWARRRRSARSRAGTSTPADAYFEWLCRSALACDLEGLADSFEPLAACCCDAFRAAGDACRRLEQGGMDEADAPLSGCASQTMLRPNPMLSKILSYRNPKPKS